MSRWRALEGIVPDSNGDVMLFQHTFASLLTWQSRRAWAGLRATAALALHCVPIGITCAADKDGQSIRSAPHHAAVKGLLPYRYDLAIRLGLGILTPRIQGLCETQTPISVIKCSVRRSVSFPWPVSRGR